MRERFALVEDFQTNTDAWPCGQLVIRSINDRLERVPGSRTFGRYAERRVAIQKHAVPVKALFENLESGATVDQFLEWFPGVTTQQALAVLEFAEKTLAAT